jgi:trigger factor
VWGFESPLSHQGTSSLASATRLSSKEWGYTTLNITVIDQENCKKQVRLDIPGETVRVEADKIATELARKINIPGFRPGHVPKSVVKTRFRKELRDEAAQKLLPKALSEALLEKDLRVISEPAVDELKFNEDESIRVSFTVEVFPEFDLAGYKDLRLTKHVRTVTDEDVDKAVSSLRDRNAELVPIEDRPARRGDLVTVNLKGRLIPVEGQPAGEKEGQPRDPGQSTATPPERDQTLDAETEEIAQTDVELELGSEGVFEEFNAALEGARAGDIRSTSIAYGDDYRGKLAGRTVNWTAEVTAIRVKELPDLDDEFARSVEGEFNSLEELRESLKTKMESEAAERSEAELRKDALKLLTERNKFQVPESIVDKLVSSRVNAFLRSMHGKGRQLQDLGIEPERLRDIERLRAEPDVRAMYVLGRIAAEEDIEASEGEVDLEVQELAQASGQTFEALKARLTKESSLDSIKEQIENRKALDFVIASADIRTEDVRTSDARGDQAGEGGEERQVEADAAEPE